MGHTACSRRRPVDGELHQAEGSVSEVFHLHVQRLVVPALTSALSGADLDRRPSGGKQRAPPATAIVFTSALRKSHRTCRSAAALLEGRRPSAGPTKVPMGLLLVSFTSDLPGARRAGAGVQISAPLVKTSCLCARILQLPAWPQQAPQRGSMAPVSESSLQPTSLTAAIRLSAGAGDHTWSSRRTSGAALTGKALISTAGVAVAAGLALTNTLRPTSGLLPGDSL